MKEQTERTQGTAGWRGGEGRLGQLWPVCLFKAQYRGKAQSYLFWTLLLLVLALFACVPECMGNVIYPFSLWEVYRSGVEVCSGLQHQGTTVLFWHRYIKQLGFPLVRILLHSHLIEQQKTTIYTQFFFLSLLGYTIQLPSEILNSMGIKFQALLRRKYDIMRHSCCSG